jgi:hypothetical protein
MYLLYLVGCDIDKFCLFFSYRLVEKIEQLFLSRQQRQGVVQSLLNREKRDVRTLGKELDQIIEDFGVSSNMIFSICSRLSDYR